MSAVLTGGSAAALYAPQAYMSHDADFVLEADDPLDNVAIALEPIGFVRDGKSRIFVHPTSPFTVDFPKGPLAVGGEYVHETHVIKRRGTRLHVLTRTDCIRDRLAHFYFWSDYTALNAAVAVAARNTHKADLDVLRAGPNASLPRCSRNSPSSNGGCALNERSDRRERGPRRSAGGYC